MGGLPAPFVPRSTSGSDALVVHRFHIRFLGTPARAPLSRVTVGKLGGSALPRPLTRTASETSCEDKTRRANIDPAAPEKPLGRRAASGSTDPGYNHV